ncbi:MAG: tetratricopeptide repeat protein, partial [Proteobacteria bacterium]|nr:tetratricopeptide repeat protein [Pseudomonadota bacterium]
EPAPAPKPEIAPEPEPAPEPESAPEAEAQQEPALGTIPPAEDDTWEAGAPPELREPTWTSTRITGSSTAPDDFDMPPKRRRRVALFVTLSLLVAAAAAVYLLLPHKDSVKSQLGEVVSSKDQGRHRALLLKGREDFLLDTPAAWERADKNFQRVLELSPQHPQALASLAQLHAVWAQHLYDADVDARWDAHAQGQAPTPQIDKNTQRFESRLTTAQQWATRAVREAADLPDAHLAMADVLRLRGDLEGAQQHLQALPKNSHNAEYHYVHALFLLASGTHVDHVTRELEAALPVPPSLRMLYRIARLQAAQQQHNEARATLERILLLNAKHDPSRTLMERLNRNLPIALAKPPQPSADTSSDTASDEEQLARADGTDSALSAPITDVDDDATAEDTARIKLARAMRMQERGNWSEAARLYGDVLSVEPSNLDALVGMGYAQLELRATGQAIAHFRRALGQNAAYGPAVSGMGDAYRAQGQNDEAIKWYQRYLDAHPNGSQASHAQRHLTALSAPPRTDDTSAAPAPIPSSDTESPQDADVTPTPQTTDDPTPPKGTDAPPSTAPPENTPAPPPTAPGDSENSAPPPIAPSPQAPPATSDDA